MPFVLIQFHAGMLNYRVILEQHNCCRDESLQANHAFQCLVRSHSLSRCCTAHSTDFACALNRVWKCKKCCSKLAMPSLLMHQSLLLSQTWHKPIDTCWPALITKVLLQQQCSAS